MAPPSVWVEEAIHHIMQTCRESLLLMRRHVQQQPQRMKEVLATVASTTHCLASRRRSTSSSPSLEEACFSFPRFFSFVCSRHKYYQEYDWYILSRHVRMPVECMLVNGEGGGGGGDGARCTSSFAIGGRHGRPEGSFSPTPYDHTTSREPFSDAQEGAPRRTSTSSSSSTTGFPVYHPHHASVLEWRWIEEVDAISLSDQLHLARVARRQYEREGETSREHYHTQPRNTKEEKEGTVQKEEKGEEEKNAVHALQQCDAAREEEVVSPFFSDGQVYRLWQELMATALAVWRQRNLLYPPALQSFTVWDAEQHELKRLLGLQEEEETSNEETSKKERHPDPLNVTENVQEGKHIPSPPVQHGAMSSTPRRPRSSSSLETSSHWTGARCATWVLHPLYKKKKRKGTKKRRNTVLGVASSIPDGDVETSSSSSSEEEEVHQEAVQEGDQRWQWSGVPFTASSAWALRADGPRPTPVHTFSHSTSWCTPRAANALAGSSSATTTSRLMKAGLPRSAAHGRKGSRRLARLRVTPVIEANGHHHHHHNGEGHPEKEVLAPTNMSSSAPPVWLPFGPFTPRSIGVDVSDWSAYEHLYRRFHAAFEREEQKKQPPPQGSPKKTSTKPIEEEERDRYSRFSSMASCVKQEASCFADPFSSFFPTGSSAHYTIQHLLHPLLWKHLRLWAGPRESSVCASSRYPGLSHGIDEPDGLTPMKEVPAVHRRSLRSPLSPLSRSVPLFFSTTLGKEMEGGSKDGASLLPVEKGDGKMGTTSIPTLPPRLSHLAAPFFQLLHQLEMAQQSLEGELRSLVPYLIPEHYYEARQGLHIMRKTILEAKTVAQRVLARSALLSTHAEGGQVQEGRMEMCAPLVPKREQEHVSITATSGVPILHVYGEEVSEGPETTKEAEKEKNKKEWEKRSHPGETTWKEMPAHEFQLVEAAAAALHDSSLHQQTRAKQQEERRIHEEEVARQLHRLGESCQRQCQLQHQAISQNGFTHPMQDSGWNMAVLVLEVALAEFDIPTSSHLYRVLMGGKEEEEEVDTKKKTDPQDVSSERAPPTSVDSTIPTTTTIGSSGKTHHRSDSRKSLYTPAMPPSSSSFTTPFSNTPGASSLSLLSSSSFSPFPSSSSASSTLSVPVMPLPSWCPTRTAHVFQDIQEWVRRERVWPRPSPLGSPTKTSGPAMGRTPRATREGEAGVSCVKAPPAGKNTVEHPNGEAANRASLLPSSSEGSWNVRWRPVAAGQTFLYAALQAFLEQWIPRLLTAMWAVHPPFPPAAPGNEEETKLDTTTKKKAECGEEENHSERRAPPPKEEFRGVLRTPPAVPPSSHFSSRWLQDWLLQQLVEGQQEPKEGQKNEEEHPKREAGHQESSRATPLTTWEHLKRLTFSRPSPFQLAAEWIWHLHQTYPPVTPSSSSSSRCSTTTTGEVVVILTYLFAPGMAQVLWEICGGEARQNAFHRHFSQSSTSSLSSLSTAIPLTRGAGPPTTNGPVIPKGTTLPEPTVPQTHAGYWDPSCRHAAFLLAAARAFYPPWIFTLSNAGKNKKDNRREKARAVRLLLLHAYGSSWCRSPLLWCAPPIPASLRPKERYLPLLPPLAEHQTNDEHLTQKTKENQLQRQTSSSWRKDVPSSSLFLLDPSSGSAASSFWMIEVWDLFCHCFFLFCRRHSTPSFSSAWATIPDYPFDAAASSSATTTSSSSLSLPTTVTSHPTESKNGQKDKASFPKPVPRWGWEAAPIVEAEASAFLQEEETLFLRAGDTSVVLHPTRPRRLQYLWKMWWLQFLFLGEGAAAHASPSSFPASTTTTTTTPTGERSPANPPSSSSWGSLAEVSFDLKKALLSPSLCPKYRHRAGSNSNNGKGTSSSSTFSLPFYPAGYTRRGLRSILWSLSAPEERKRNGIDSSTSSPPIPLTFLSLERWRTLLYVWWNETCPLTIPPTTSSTTTAVRLPPVCVVGSFSSTGDTSTVANTQTGGATRSTSKDGKKERPTTSSAPSRVVTLSKPSLRIRGALFPFIGNGEGLEWTTEEWDGDGHGIPRPTERNLKNTPEEESKTTEQKEGVVLLSSSSSPTVYHASRPLLAEGLRRVLQLQRPFLSSFPLRVPSLSSSASCTSSAMPVPVERTSLSVWTYTRALRRLVIYLQQWNGKTRPSLSTLPLRGPSSPLSAKGARENKKEEEAAGEKKKRTKVEEEEEVRFHPSFMPRWRYYLEKVQEAYDHPAHVDPTSSCLGKNSKTSTHRKEHSPLVSSFLSALSEEEKENGGRSHRGRENIREGMSSFSLSGRSSIAYEKAKLLRAFLLSYPLDIQDVEDERDSRHHEDDEEEKTEARTPDTSPRTGPTPPPASPTPSSCMEPTAARSSWTPRKASTLLIRPFLPPSLRVEVWSILLGLPSREEQQYKYASLCAAREEMLRPPSSLGSSSSVEVQRYQLLLQQEKQLFLDLPRCQAGDPLFAANGVAQQMLLQVLRCFIISRYMRSAPLPSTPVLASPLATVTTRTVLTERNASPPRSCSRRRKKESNPAHTHLHNTTTTTAAGPPLTKTSAYYFQGLDSLGAVLVRLASPSSPALIFALLDSIVQGYVAYDLQQDTSGEGLDQHPSTADHARFSPFFTPTSTVRMASTTTTSRGEADHQPQQHDAGGGGGHRTPNHQEDQSGEIVSSRFTRVSLSDQLGRLTAMVQYVDPELWEHLMPSVSASSTLSKGTKHHESTIMTEGHPLSQGTPAPRPPREGVQPDYFSVSWFLTLFAHTLPYHQVLRVWDVLFLYAPPLWQRIPSSSFSSLSSPSGTSLSCTMSTLLQQELYRMGKSAYDEFCHRTRPMTQRRNGTEDEEGEGKTKTMTARPTAMRESTGNTITVAEERRRRLEWIRAQEDDPHPPHEEDEDEDDEDEALEEEVLRSLLQGRGKSEREGPDIASTTITDGAPPFYPHALLCLCVALIRQRRTVLLSQHQFHTLLKTVTTLTLPVSWDGPPDLGAGGGTSFPVGYARSGGDGGTSSASSSSSVISFSLETWLHDAVVLMHTVPSSVGLQAYSDPSTALLLRAQWERPWVSSASWITRASTPFLARMAEKERTMSTRRSRRQGTAAVPLMWKVRATLVPAVLHPFLFSRPTSITTTTSSKNGATRKKKKKKGGGPPVVATMDPTAEHGENKKEEEEEEEDLLRSGGQKTTRRVEPSTLSCLSPAEVVPFISVSDVWMYWKQAEKAHEAAVHTPRSPFAFPSVAEPTTHSTTKKKQKQQPPPPPSFHEEDGDPSEGVSRTPEPEGYPATDPTICSRFPGLFLIDARTLPPLPPALVSWMFSSSPSHHEDVTTTIRVNTKKKNGIEAAEEATMTSRDTQSSFSSVWTSSKEEKRNEEHGPRPSMTSPASRGSVTSPLSHLPRESLLLMEDDDDDEDEEEEEEVRRDTRSKERNTTQEGNSSSVDGGGGGGGDSSPNEAEKEEEREKRGGGRPSSASTAQTSFFSSVSTSSMSAPAVHDIGDDDDEGNQKTAFDDGACESGIGWSPFFGGGEAVACTAYLTKQRRAVFPRVHDHISFLSTNSHRDRTPYSSSSTSSSLHPCTCARCGTIAGALRLSFLSTTDLSCVDDACIELLELIPHASSLAFIPPFFFPYASRSAASSFQDATAVVTPFPHIVFVLSSLPLLLFSNPAAATAVRAALSEEKDTEEEEEEETPMPTDVNPAPSHAKPRRTFLASPQERDEENEPRTSPASLRKLLQEQVEGWRREEAMVKAVIHRLQQEYHVCNVSLLAGGAAALRECYPRWFIPSRLGARERMR